MKTDFAKCLVMGTLFMLCACGGSSDDNPTPVPTPQTDRAGAVMNGLWATSPEVMSVERQAAFDSLQAWADGCAAEVFKTYLTASDPMARSLQKAYPILAAYDLAFDHVKSALEKDHPAKGQVFVYMLYNMGYVVRTPESTFGIDLYHRRAVELEPYLDFICMTHIHQDHRSDALTEAMQKKGKPVLSNFLAQGPYTATAAADYELGGTKVHTFITDHNNGETNVPVTVFDIDCGEAAGHLSLMHSGDSNFKPEQFPVTGPSDVYILRYAPNALTENNVVGAVVTPRHALLSHILELSHADPSASRWTLEQGLRRASSLNCAQAVMPFWGERMTYSNE